MIDADAFRRELDDHYPFTKAEQSKHGMADIAKSAVLFVLNKMPTIEPQQRTGKWTNNMNGTFTCDKCGCKHSKSNYCPNCGAKMDGGDT